jgi:hypothetical protein
MEDVQSYDLFMKNATDEKNQFFLLGVINTTYYYSNSYYSFELYDVKNNSEFHFMYRAVNIMGKGLNSSIL